MKITDKNLFFVGRLLFKRFGVPDFLGRESNALLLKLYGPKTYGLTLEKHWSKRYSIHLYISILALLILPNHDLISKIAYTIGFAIAWHYYAIAALKEKYRQHHLILMDGFFTFSTLFTLMINAGLNQRYALEKSIGNHGFSPYLIVAHQQIRSGMPEAAVYEELSSRFREPLISRYFGCIIQGQHYGNSKLKDDLKRITQENWQEKLNIHRKAGEQLKTKLLLPLMLIFVGILLVLMLPVIVQFNQIV